MVSYYAMKLLSWVCCLLPGSLCNFVGQHLAEALWVVVPEKRKKMSRENIMRCLGVDAQEAERISKASAVRFGPMLFEVLRFPVIKKNMDKYVTVEGAEAIKETMAQGTGGIIITSHSGNWELMGGAFAQNGIPLVGVAMKQKSGGMDRFIVEYRNLIGMHITYKTDVREMFDMMAKGWYIGLIMDQDTNKHDGVVLDFFGRRTNCVPGAASMGRFKRVPIFSAFMHRNPDGTHVLKVQPAIYVERTKDKKADIAKVTQLLTKKIEDNIRMYPEEWFWLHDRWKSMREEYGEEKA